MRHDSTQPQFTLRRARSDASPPGRSHWQQPLHATPGGAGALNRDHPETKHHDYSCLNSPRPLVEPGVGRVPRARHGRLQARFLIVFFWRRAFIRRQLRLIELIEGRWQRFERRWRFHAIRRLEWWQLRWLSGRFQLARQQRRHAGRLVRRIEGWQIGWSAFCRTKRIERRGGRRQHWCWAPWHIERRSRWRVRQLSERR